MTIETVHVVEEGTICLFAGEIEVWHNHCAETIRMSTALEKRMSRPSGARYPIPHHVGETHIIELGSVWMVEHPETPTGAALTFVPQRNQLYTMVITFREEADPRRWVRRTYHGVTHDSLNLNSRDMMEFLGDRAFEAQYMVEDSGWGEPE
jgi:hypothetical protein